MDKLELGRTVLKKLSQRLSDNKMAGIPITSSGIPITPRTLNMENLINKIELDKIGRASGEYKYPNTFLLSADYFDPIKNERDYPYIDIGPKEYVSGFAPSTQEIYSTFPRGDDVSRLMQDAIVLNKDSEANKGGEMPRIYRHELAHATTPNLYGSSITDEYVDKMPNDWKEFLARYPESHQDEELKADIYSDRKMPQNAELLKLIKQRLAQRIGY